MTSAITQIHVVNMTKKISTIVDFLVPNFLLIVNMTKKISTIVDPYFRLLMLKVSIWLKKFLLLWIPFLLVYYNSY